MYHYFYKITNNINGKYYYGVHSTNDMNDGYMGSGKYLRNAINKYGESNFTKEIIEYFDCSEDMYKYEASIVNEKLLKDPMCYNIAIGGCGGDRFYTMTAEEQEIFKNKISKAHKGKKHSQEWKQHMSESQKGRIISDEHRKKMSDAAKLKIGEKNNFYGKHHSIETRKKISDANKGSISPNKGKEMSEEQKEKLRGRKRTLEQRKKISEATKKAMQDPKIKEKCSHKGQAHPFYGKHWKTVDGKRIWY